MAMSMAKAEGQMTTVIEIQHWHSTLGTDAAVFQKRVRLGVRLTIA